MTLATWVLAFATVGLMFATIGLLITTSRYTKVTRQMPMVTKVDLAYQIVENIQGKTGPHGQHIDILAPEGSAMMDELGKKLKKVCGEKVWRIFEDA